MGILFNGDIIVINNLLTQLIMHVKSTNKLIYIV